MQLVLCSASLILSVRSTKFRVFYYDDDDGVITFVIMLVIIIVTNRLFSFLTISLDTLKPHLSGPREDVRGVRTTAVSCGAQLGCRLCLQRLCQLSLPATYLWEIKE